MFPVWFAPQGQQEARRQAVQCKRRPDDRWHDMNIGRPRDLPEQLATFPTDFFIDRQV